MEILNVAAQLAGISGYDLRRILEGLSARRAPTKAISGANARLLSIAAADDDPLCGRWHTALWRYQWRAGPSADWSDAPYHVDGVLYVLFKYPGEAKWKATLVLNYAWQRGRQRWLPARVLKALDRRRGKVFSVVYDIELLERNPHVFSGPATMTYRSPDIGRRYSGRFPQLRVTRDGDLQGEYHSTDPQPKPMQEARADVRFHHRTRWDAIELE